MSKASCMLDLVFPVYNEERQLRKSVCTTIDYLQKNAKITYQITIANNGSTDRTEEIAKDLAKEFSEVNYLMVDGKGVGLALKTAWSISTSPIIGFMDIDLSTDIKHLSEAFHYMERDNIDIVIGSRLLKDSSVIGRKPLREVTSRGLNYLLQWYLQVHFSDALCGFKFLKKTVFDAVSSKGLNDNEWFFEPELLIKAEWLGFQIHEIPVRWIDDPDSKVEVTKTVMKFLKNIYDIGREKRSYGK